MIYPIIAYGDSILRQVAENITQNTDVKQLIADMYETMYSANGIGLAAPQIGKSIRLFVVDATKLEDEEDKNLKTFKKVFLNAEILEENGKDWVMEEGCLSIPGIRENITRPDTITIKYFDENWNQYEETYSGLSARIIQHEYDHIEGVLFTDYMSPLKKRLLKNKLINISKGVANADYKMKFPLANKSR
jgi:peptide deformylase